MNESEEQTNNIIGAVPADARPDDENSAATAVRNMFSSIAPRYDLLNHVLSFNVDRVWWWRTARSFSQILGNPDTTILDLCCGTGDMTFALRRRAGHNGSAIWGADFAHPMLVRAKGKSTDKDLHWVEADALQLPFSAGRFDLVVSAFGFRNLANYDSGLGEIHRVLKPGGQIGILDFGEPKGVVGKVYRVYFRHVLPAIGTVISGVKGPYRYLPISVEKFPSPDQMLKRMDNAGFREVSWTPYNFGIAGLYRGTK